jgi:hypothetical protein
MRRQQLSAVHRAVVCECDSAAAGVLCAEISLPRSMITVLEAVPALLYCTAIGSIVGQVLPQER